MALGNIEWKESKWAIDFSKFSGPASIPIAAPGFGAARDAGELTINLDRAPVAIVDGVTLGQSRPIERYLARRLGLLGVNEIEAAHIDAVTEHVRDCKDKYQKAKGVSKDEVAKFFAETMPEYMGKFEKAVAPLGTGAPLVGSKLSLADVCLFVFLTDFFDDKAGALASIDKCPRLQASLKAVGENPGIVKYRASRDLKAT